MPAAHRRPDRRHALKARSAVASSFAAVLELAREGELQAEQEEEFGPIRQDQGRATKG